MIYNKVELEAMHLFISILCSYFLICSWTLSDQITKKTIHRDPTSNQNLSFSSVCALRPWPNSASETATSGCGPALLLLLDGPRGERGDPLPLGEPWRRGAQRNWLNCLQIKYHQIQYHIMDVHNFVGKCA